MVPVGVGKLVAPYVIRCAIRGARGMQGRVHAFKETWGAAWVTGRDSALSLHQGPPSGGARGPAPDGQRPGALGLAGAGLCQMGLVPCSHMGCFPQGPWGLGAGSLSLVLLSGWTVSPGDQGWVEVGSCPYSEAGGAPSPQLTFHLPKSHPVQ